MCCRRKQSKSQHRQPYNAEQGLAAAPPSTSSSSRGPTHSGTAWGYA
jgi:hypothetical protein